MRPASVAGLGSAKTIEAGLAKLNYFRCDVSMSPRTAKKETEVVSVRMSSTLKKRLQDLAEKEHRSLNGQIVWALEQWLQGQDQEGERSEH